MAIVPFRPIASWTPARNSERTAHKAHPTWEGHPEPVRFGYIACFLIRPVGSREEARWVEPSQIVWGDT